MTRILMLVPIVLLLAADAADDAAKKELEQFQGTWTPTKYVKEGNKTGDAVLAQIQLVIKGNKSAFSKGAAPPTHGTYKLNPAKTPKELDITLTDGEDKGKVFLAIYEFKDDELTICIAPPGKDRPKEFDSKGGSGHILEVWKRKK